MPVPTRTALATVAAMLLLFVAPAASALPGGVPVSAADSGSAIAFGRNTDGQAEVPALPPGVTYTAAAADEMHTVLLRSDGNVVAFGLATDGQLDVPPLPVGTTYTAVAAGFIHTLLLRSDGEVVAFGDNFYGQTDVPPLPVGLTYTGVAAGWMNSLVLRSDGEMIAFGDNDRGQGDVPPLPVGVTYTAMDTTYHHLVLLRSDGTVATAGENTEGQLDVPPLPDGLAYTDISANAATTLLVRSDGEAFGFGRNVAGQADVPPLPGGTTYLDGDVGENHALLLRSDGVVVAFGGNASGHTTVPPAPTGTRYTAFAAGTEVTVLIRSAVATTTTVTAPSPVAAAATVTFSATVTPAADPGVDFTGTVRFTYEDTSTEDVAIAADGTAEVDRTAPATPGSLTATARYLGSTDGTFAASAPSSVATATVPDPGPVTIELTVVGGAASVAQGGTLTFEVTGEDAFGDPVPIDPADITLTSSVATDEVTGLVVTFPHASPHTITARFGLTGPTSAVTVNVIPAATVGALGATGQNVASTAGVGILILSLGGALVAISLGRHRRPPADIRSPVGH